MIKYEIENRRTTSLEVCGDLHELAADTLHMIGLIYERIYRADQELGEDYRRLITAGVLFRDSPVFKPGNHIGNVQDICMIVPKTRGGGKEQNHE